MGDSAEADIHRILFGRELHSETSPEFLTSLRQLMYADTVQRTPTQMRLHAFRLLSTLNKLGMDTSVGILWCLQREENYLRALGYAKSFFDESLYTRILKILTFIGNQLARLEVAFNILNIEDSFKDRLEAIEQQENIHNNTPCVIIAQRLKQIFEHRAAQH